MWPILWPILWSIYFLLLLLEMQRDLACLLLLLVGTHTAQALRGNADYQYFCTGNCDTNVQGDTKPGTGTHRQFTSHK